MSDIGYGSLVVVNDNWLYEAVGTATSVWGEVWICRSLVTSKMSIQFPNRMRLAKDKDILNFLNHMFQFEVGE